MAYPRGTPNDEAHIIGPFSGTDASGRPWRLCDACHSGIDPVSRKCLCDQMIRCQASHWFGWKACPCTVVVALGYPYLCGIHLEAWMARAPRDQRGSAVPFPRYDPSPLLWTVPINDQQAVYHFCQPPAVCLREIEPCEADPAYEKTVARRRRASGYPPLSPFSLAARMELSTGLSTGETHEN